MKTKQKLQNHAQRYKNYFRSANFFAKKMMRFFTHLRQLNIFMHSTAFTQSVLVHIPMNRICSFTY